MKKYILMNKTMPVLSFVYNERRGDVEVISDVFQLDSLNTKNVIMILRSMTGLPHAMDITAQ